MDPINITDIQEDETNVNWYDDGEKANKSVLNRPLKQIAEFINNIIFAITPLQIREALKTVDGTGSGVDADVVDGIHADQFLRSDTSDEMSGNLIAQGLFVKVSGANYTVWNAYNDGPESGLNADLLDGNHSSYFQEKLVSGSNIKTVGGLNILGSGDLPIYPTGGGSDQIFWENDTIITTSYEVTTGKNAMTAGNITINNGVTITIPSGSRWVVV